MRLPNVRLAAARLGVPPRVRLQGLEELFARTAAAFGSPVPAPRGRGPAARLMEYAGFTRACAEETLARAERGARADCGGSGGPSAGAGEAAAPGADPADLAGLERRLYRAARRLGGRYRVRLRLRSAAEALAAARIIYRGLGIDFRSSPEGKIVVRRCSFASVYSPRVCALVSALDRGLLAGLARGGELRFTQRLTDGAACCRAQFDAAATT